MRNLNDDLSIASGNGLSGGGPLLILPRRYTSRGEFDVKVVFSVKRPGTFSEAKDNSHCYQFNTKVIIPSLSSIAICADEMTSGNLTTLNTLENETLQSKTEVEISTLADNVTDFLIYAPLQGGQVNLGRISPILDNKRYILHQSGTLSVVDAIDSPCEQ